MPSTSVFEWWVKPAPPATYKAPELRGRAIDQLDERGNLVKRWANVGEINRAYEITNPKLIYNAIHRRTPYRDSFWRFA